MNIYYTQSLRGKPAMMANGIRYLMMSDNAKRTLWRCSYMATKSLKCPARITEIKCHPKNKYVINKGEHIHAELKRGKYLVKSDSNPVNVYECYTPMTIEESIVGSDYENWVNE